MLAKKKAEQIKKYVDFDVVDENWSAYELEDDAIIRIKSVLMNIEELILNKNKKGKLNLGAQLLTTVYSSPSHKREEGKVWTVEELENAIIKPNMKFNTIKDGGSARYKTGKGLITIRHILKRIDKTSKFDIQGNPAYIIRSENEVLIEGPHTSSKKT